MKNKRTQESPDILVTGRHVSITDSVKDYVQKKILRAIKNVPKVHGIHVILDVERFKKKAEVVIVLHHMKVRAAADSEDIMASIDIVVDKLQKQLHKYKEKLQDRHRGSGIKEFTLHEEYSPLQAEEERKPRLVKTRALDPKPMSVDEAVMQLGISDDFFIVFRNSQSDQLNVVYHRDDGDVGLIEPD